MDERAQSCLGGRSNEISMPVKRPTRLARREDPVKLNSRLVGQRGVS